MEANPFTNILCHMKKIVFFLAVVPLFFSCEHAATRTNCEYTARIIGYELNCRTCIVDFPYDSVSVRQVIGKSRSNHYGAVNLNMADYEIGQLIKVNIRKPEPNDLKACITLYPTYDIQGVYVTHSEDYNNMIYNDTIPISCGDCLHDHINRFYLCLDSVSDSRCPEGAECFWEGNAEARFKFEKYNETPHFFSLNTHLQFRRDTTIDHYKFTLINVRPAPSLKHPVSQGDYQANILIQKE
jgi:hypothetical protein